MSDSSNPFGNTYSQACTEAFAKFVPGFDFLQGLVKNAGQTLPSIGQWVAPTLDPQELDKRIGELRTVQFWLEQNARMIATTRRGSCGSSESFSIEPTEMPLYWTGLPTDRPVTASSNTIM